MSEKPEDEEDAMECPVREIEGMLQDEAYKKLNPVANFFHGAGRCIILLILVILFGIVYAVKTGLDLPYALKRGGHLFFLKDSVSGEDEGYIKLPKMLQTLVDIVFDEKKTVGADALDDATDVQAGGAGKDNQENETVNSGATETQQQEMEDEAAKRVKMGIGEANVLKYNDVYEWDQRIKWIFTVIEKLTFGTVGPRSNNMTISYLLSINHQLYNDDTYLRDFINNNFDDIPSVMISLNLINILEDIGAKIQLDEELEKEIQDKSLPAIEVDTYDLYSNGDEKGTDPIKKAFNDMSQDLETFYKEEFLKYDSVKVDQSSDKKSEESHQEQQQKENPSIDQGQTSSEGQGSIGEKANAQEKPKSEEKIPKNGEPMTSDAQGPIAQGNQASSDGQGPNAQGNQASSDGQQSPDRQEQAQVSSDGASQVTKPDGQEQAQGPIDGASDGASQVAQTDGASKIPTTMNKIKDFGMGVAQTASGIATGTMQAARTTKDVAMGTASAIGSVASGTVQAGRDFRNSFKKGMATVASPFAAAGKKTMNIAKGKVGDSKINKKTGEASESNVNKGLEELEAELKAIDVDQKKVFFGKLIKYSKMCEDNPEMKKKIFQISVLEKLNDNPAATMNSWAARNIGDYANSFGIYTSTIFGTLIPRYFHSINKLLNYFEFHNLGSLFVFIFKRIKDDGLFTISEQEGTKENQIINRLKYAESSIHKFIAKKKYDGIEAIRLALIYGYLKYDIQISKINNLDAMDKFYLKMMSIIVSNLKIKNHLIDILKRLYLNNKFIQNYNMDQKELWYKDYFMEKRVIMKKKLKIKHNTYEQLVSDKSEENADNILKVNALFSMSDAYSLMIDSTEHACFLSTNKDCNVLYKGEKKSNESKKEVKSQQGGGSLYNYERDNKKIYDNIVYNNLEYFYDKNKVMKTNRVKRRNIKKGKNKSKNKSNRKYKFSKSKKTKKKSVYRRQSNEKTKKRRRSRKRN